MTMPKREITFYHYDICTSGSALAMVISYVQNHSIIWAIIHSIFSWAYVIYYALGYGR